MEPYNENEAVCDLCRGEGLISTGSVPHDLSSGNKVTCTACGGTAKVVGENAAPAGVSTGDNATDSSVGQSADPQTETDPKDQEPNQAQATGDGSGTPSSDEVKLPQIGDPCLNDANVQGTLQKGENDEWICVVPQS